MKNPELTLLEKMTDLYNTEKMLLQTLPKMGKAASCKHLKEAIFCHLEETREHVAKFEETYLFCQLAADRLNGEAAEAVMNGSGRMVRATGGSDAVREVLEAMVRKLDKYEAATYACLHEWAELLGSNKASAILGELLEDEAVEGGFDLSGCPVVRE